MSNPKIKVELATLSERVNMAEALRGPGARLPGEDDEAYAKRRGISAMLFAAMKEQGKVPAFVPVAA